MYSLLDNNEDFDQSVSLTPRSLEACNRQGIDPTDLVKKPLDSFDGDDGFAQMRYDHHESMRSRLLNDAIEERIRMHKVDSSGVEKRSGSISGIIQKETKALLALERRTHAELRNSLESEIAFKKMMARSSSLEKLEARKAEQAKEKAKKKQEVLEYTRQRQYEAAKKLEEDELRKKKEYSEREKQAKDRIIEQQEKAAKQRVESRNAREVKARMRRQEFEEKQVAINEENARRERQLRMKCEEEERERETRLILKRQKEAEEMLERQKRQEKLRKQARETNAKLALDLERKLHEKQKLVAQRRDEQNKQKELELKERMEADAIRKENALSRTRKIYETEEKRRNELLQKQQLQEERVNNVKCERGRQIAEKRAKQKLVSQMIAKQVKRRQKIEDFRRKQMEEKTIEDQIKAEAIQKEKELLIARRKELVFNGRKRREEITVAFEKVKDPKILTNKNHHQRKNFVSIIDDVFGDGEGERLVSAIVEDANSPNLPDFLRKTGSRPKSARSSSQESKSQSVDRPKSARPQQSKAKSLLSAYMKPKKKKGASVSDINALKMKQSQQLLVILEKEQNVEKERLAKLSTINNAMERKRLEVIFGYERKEASDHILHIVEKHNKALEALKNEGK